MSQFNLENSTRPSIPNSHLKQMIKVDSEKIFQLQHPFNHQFINPPKQKEDILKSKFQIFQSNEDICFKCKQYGEIYCCENCFRSFHWKCIGIKKKNQLSNLTHTINFVCQSCDIQNICLKCNLNCQTNQSKILDFPEHDLFLKCSHCYVKIHRTCLNLPFEALNKTLQENRINQKIPVIKNYNFSLYLCSGCIQNVGITQIILTHRMNNVFGIQTLYYYVLLNTKSPIHKGWVEEYSLRNHLKKITGSRSLVSEFIVDNSLFRQPQIDKIIALRSPLKYKGIQSSEIIKLIEKKNNQNYEKYGDPNNFHFLIKWKRRDYTSLTWEDQTILLNNFGVLKDFLIERENQWSIIEHVRQIQNKRKLQKSAVETDYKVLEHFLSRQPKITQKFLLQQKQISLEIYDNSAVKSFQQKMAEIDRQNAKTSFMEIIEVDFQKASHQKENQQVHKIVGYLEKCYLTQIILRPTIIISNRLNQWQEIIKSRKKSGSLYLKFIRFEGSKKNTDSMKDWDFFAYKNPNIYKFHIILIDCNYFLFQGKFIFDKIPSLLFVIFDELCKQNESQQKLKMIEKTYLPFRSQISKQIYLLQNSINKEHKENFINSLLSLHKSLKFPIRKVILHNLSFSNIKEYVSAQSSLKIILQKKFKDTQKIFEVPEEKGLNQGQRLSFLKFILSFGLNVKKIQNVCAKLKQINPSIWDSYKNDSENMERIIKQYLTLFMSIISNRQKDQFSKNNRAHLNYFIFNYTADMILKRIIQLKRLKNQVESNSQDHSKFPINKPFKFFSSGQCKNFPLWNIYQDYTLGALIIEEGYQMWSRIINSRKWADYHSQLETRKIFQLDSKAGTFIVQEKIVPIKKKVSLLNQNLKITEINKKTGEDVTFTNQVNKISKDKVEEEQVPVTYGDYLLKKIRNSKQFKEIEYEKLDQINVLQGHIAERGDSILLAMN